MSDPIHWFFKCDNPGQAVYLSGMSAYCKFNPVSDSIGVMVTTKETVAQELRAAQQRNISGVREVTADEYNALCEKKKLWVPLQPGWREQIQRPRTTPTTVKKEVEEPSRKSAPEVATVTETKAPLVQTTLPQEHKPVAVRRRNPREPNKL